MTWRALLDYEDQRFCLIFTLFRQLPHQDWGRAVSAGILFACDDKEPGPSWENNYPEKDPVKPPRRDTRALSPAHAISAYAQYVFLLSLQIGSIN